MSPLADLTCVDVEAMLPMIADAAIGPEDDPGVFAHLAGCPDCQRSLARHDLLGMALGQQPRPIPRARRWWPIPLATAATLVIGSAITVAVVAEPPPKPVIVEQILHDHGKAPTYRIQVDGRVHHVNLDLIDGGTPSSADRIDGGRTVGTR